MLDSSYKDRERFTIFGPLDNTGQRGPKPDDKTELLVYKEVQDQLDYCKSLDHLNVHITTGQ